MLFHARTANKRFSTRFLFYRGVVGFYEGSNTFGNRFILIRFTEEVPYVIRHVKVGEIENLTGQTISKHEKVPIAFQFNFRYQFPDAKNRGLSEWLVDLYELS